mgnify:CR=1 FL=1
MSISIKRKIGQLIISGFRGKTLKECSDVLNFITEYNIGGVILFDEDLEIGTPGTRNIESPDQLKDLTDKLQNISENSLELNPYRSCTIFALVMIMFLFKSPLLLKTPEDIKGIVFFIGLKEASG